jgi:hypothetical protein
MQLPEFNLVGVTDEQIDELTRETIYEFLFRKSFDADHPKSYIDCDGYYYEYKSCHSSVVFVSLADLAFAFRNWVRDVAGEHYYRVYIQFIDHGAAPVLIWIKAGLKVMRDMQEGNE